MKKVLFPTDFSATATHAYGIAASFARAYNAELVLLHVVEPPAAALRFVSEYNDELSIREARRIADDFIKDNPLEGVEVSRMVKIGKAFRMIAQAAFEIDPVVVVMGTHGASGFSEEFIGSNTRRVLKLVACPVVSVPEDMVKASVERILVPLDLNHPVKENFEFGLSICKQFEAEMHILSVMEPGATEEQRGKMNEKLQTQLDRATKQSVRATGELLTTSEYIPEVILDYAREKDFGMICMMTIREKGIMDFVMGSTAKKIIHRSKIPVVAARPKKLFKRMREGSIFG